MRRGKTESDGSGRPVLIWKKYSALRYDPMVPQLSFPDRKAANWYRTCSERGKGG